MKKMWLSALILASTMTLAATAQARGGSGSGFLFDLNLYYGTSKVDDTYSGAVTHQSDTKSAVYDVKLGYLTDSGLYLGGIYTSRSDSALNASGTAGSAMGGSLGYVGSGGFFIMGHYLVGASSGEYKEGTGMQVDVGYKAGVGNGWLIGAEFTYRDITYKKNDSLAATFESRQVSEVMPMISIGYMF